MRARIIIALFVVPLLALSACEEEEDDAPAILWTAMRPHADRGECTRCHLRLDSNGNPVPMIPSWARMPHADRGVCTNCHLISRGDNGLAAARVARDQEAGWLGMQLAPLSGSSRGGGMVVTEVEGIARRAGVMPGDVLLAVNGTPVASPRDLGQARLGRASEDATLLIGRDGRVLTVVVENAIQVALPVEAQSGAPRRF